jgi:hypothetical protein
MRPKMTDALSGTRKAQDSGTTREKTTFVSRVCNRADSLEPRRSRRTLNAFNTEPKKTFTAEHTEGTEKRTISFPEAGCSIPGSQTPATSSNRSSPSCLRRAIGRHAVILATAFSFARAPGRVAKIRHRGLGPALRVERRQLCPCRRHVFPCSE